MSLVKDNIKLIMGNKGSGGIWLYYYIRLYNKVYVSSFYLIMFFGLVRWKIRTLHLI